MLLESTAVTKIAQLIYISKTQALIKKGYWSPNIYSTINTVQLVASQQRARAMEFHDILHGQIFFPNGDELTGLLYDLINSPEINRLRNMRQMNFDVPLIQELGRSRRLPHSIGVASLAYRLAKKSALSTPDSKVLIAAAILHDAAIPPYGHLVESEFKASNPDFKHENRVDGLIRGLISTANKFQSIVPGKVLEVHNILNRHHVDLEKVISVICPPDGRKSPISADIDLDNIDNVHRMAAMLGWSNAKENFTEIYNSVRIKGLGQMSFAKGVGGAVEQWLDFRQRIYTLIIAHPECVPYNALQVDLVRQAINEKIITPDHWWLSEPEFEEAMRQSPSLKSLASQLISGCEYSLIDYVWLKGIDSSRKLHNAQIVAEMERSLPQSADYGYFVWNEKGLISRQIKIQGEGWSGGSFGENSASCMLALVKKTPGFGKRTKSQLQNWRKKAIDRLSNYLEISDFEVDFPEDYTGSYLVSKNNEIKFQF